MFWGFVLFSSVFVFSFVLVSEQSFLGLRHGVIDLLLLGVVEARPRTLAAVLLTAVAVVVGGVPEVLLAANALADPLLGLLLGLLRGRGRRGRRGGHRSGHRGGLLGLPRGRGAREHLRLVLGAEDLLGLLCGGSHGGGRSHRHRGASGAGLLLGQLLVPLGAAGGRGGGGLGAGLRLPLGCLRHGVLAAGWLARLWVRPGICLHLLPGLGDQLVPGHHARRDLLLRLSHGGGGRGGGHGRGGVALEELEQLGHGQVRHGLVEQRGHLVSGLAEVGGGLQSESRAEQRSPREQDRDVLLKRDTDL